MDYVLSIGNVFLVGVKIVFWVASIFAVIKLVRFVVSGKGKRRKPPLSSFFGGQEPTEDIEFDHETSAWRYHPQTLIRRMTARKNIKPPNVDFKAPTPEKPTEAMKPGIGVIQFRSSERGMDSIIFSRLVDEVAFNHTQGLIQRAVVVIDSPGGYVHEYGLMYAQMERLRALEIEVDVCIDRLGASGGYMMALPGTKIYAAPFSMVGSVGVVASFMNIHDALKHLLINPRQYTAGTSKRLLSATQPIEPAQEEQFKAKLESMHQQFLACLEKYRNEANKEEVSSADSWTAQESVVKKLGLVDEISTSNEVLFKLNQDFDLIHFSKLQSKTPAFLSRFAASVVDAFFDRLLVLARESVEFRI